MAGVLRPPFDTPEAVRGAELEYARMLRRGKQRDADVLAAPLIAYYVEQLDMPEDAVWRRLTTVAAIGAEHLAGHRGSGSWLTRVDARYVCVVLRDPHRVCLVADGDVWRLPGSGLAYGASALRAARRMVGLNSAQSVVDFYSSEWGTGRWTLFYACLANVTTHRAREVRGWLHPEARLFQSNRVLTELPLSPLARRVLSCPELR